MACLYEELLELNERIAIYDNKIDALCKSNDACQRISKVEGIGPIAANVAAVGNPEVFKNSMHFSEYLGLVHKLV